MARGSYEQRCGVAAALDVVGERWSLLVVRELLLGPLRFTDLHRELPRAGLNVLSGRLRELEAAGVLIRRRLPAPAAATVYELTEGGRALEPVLLALQDWGVTRLPEHGEGELLPGPVGYYLFTQLQGLSGPLPHATYEIRLSGHDDLGTFTLTTGPDGARLTRGHSATASASITLSLATLMELAAEPEDLHPGSADVHLTGAPDAQHELTRLLATALSA